ncbi:hypothetical protein BC567DRAFT_80448 [Phyllosticta citribraziliensis]
MDWRAMEGDRRLLFCFFLLLNHYRLGMTTGVISGNCSLFPLPRCRPAGLPFLWSHIFPSSTFACRSIPSDPRLILSSRSSTSRFPSPPLVAVWLMHACSRILLCFDLLSRALLFHHDTSYTFLAFAMWPASSP